MVVENHLPAGALAGALRADALAGLTATPKRLPPKWFYDERGGRLFDEITRLPEYYPTRRERELLAAVAAEVAQLTGADTLVELGSGTSEKTRLLLDALRDKRTLRRFVPFDVDSATLTAAGAAVAEAYPGVAVHAVVGDFEHHLDVLPAGGRRLVAFLGSTLGNFEPEPRAEFLHAVAATLGPHDALLLGTDLVKGPERLLAAYDDSAGVTAEFNRNVLHVLNRELGADFDPDAFDHVVTWDAEREWIEMHLRAQDAVEVRVPALDLTVRFARGETIHTEVSAKFRRETVQAELAAAGLELTHWWTDPAGDVALSLAVPQERT
ncbi:L-histidine N(alpha)-methyltransferase [Kineococcus xinjiangensis]|uniref:L-histidine N(alpha)-methyltransferase n=1 Tax=Kineococcus xinjiangensis TaxID=512762 RepID=UPI001B803711